MLSRFHLGLIPERHGQTDRRTDIIVISISRVRLLTRDKNSTRTDRRRPWHTLRDDATDAQQLQ